MPLGLVFWGAAVPGRAAAFRYYIQDSKEEGDDGEPSFPAEAAP